MTKPEPTPGAASATASSTPPTLRENRVTIADANYTPPAPTGPARPVIDTSPSPDRTSEPETDIDDDGIDAAPPAEAIAAPHDTATSEDAAPAPSPTRRPSDAGELVAARVAAGQVGAAPRLDTLGRQGGATSATGRRINLDPNDAEEVEDAAFGPTLAAWLASYRERQAAAANGEVVAPPRPRPQAPTRPAPHRIAATRAHQAGGMAAEPNAAAAAPRWTSKAHGALNDMLTSMPSSPPPDFLAAQLTAGARRARPARPRWVMVAALGVLMGGTALAAFVGVARNAGLDPSITVADEGEQAIAEADDTPAGDGASGNPLGGFLAADQGGPEITLAPTRIVSASIGLPPTSAPDDRTTVVLPMTTIDTNPAQADHPGRQSAPASAAPLAAASTGQPALDQGSFGQASIEVASGGSASGDAVAIDPLPFEVAYGASDPTPADELPRFADPASLAAPQAAAEPAGSPNAVDIATAAPDFVPSPEPLDTRSPTPGVNSGALMTRAEQMMARGDVVAARLLYELAAQDGNAAAAIGAGRTYDPVHYARLGVRGIEPDSNMALAWYNSALGVGEKAALDDIEQLNTFMQR